MVIKMLKELTYYKELSENNITMKREMETTNKNQEKMNDKIAEIKNTLEVIIRRLDEAEDQISQLQNKLEKNT